MTTNICETCCREIPPTAPGGLCPVCLLKAGMSQPAEDAKPIDKTTPFPAAPMPVPTPADLAEFFPHLEVLSLLGQGGMGAVYHARQVKLDRPVALKIIRPESAADPSFAERFAREARTLARLSHPNIVGIHDFGEFAQGYFFLMEYVAGANLRQILNEGRLAQGQALSIVRQICEALQYAHDEGVIHRDIKPENILVDKSGRIKIADFGLARLNADSKANAERYFTLTGTHQVMGTPRYMAPEQIEASSRVDHRADIYSLGVVFYEMLTGEVPMGSFAPPSEKESVDQRIDNVVLKAMAREPDRRYQQVSGLAHAVNAISDPAITNPFHSNISRFDVDSPTNATMMAGADGWTAILDRDVKAVVPWVADAFTPNAGSEKRAPVLMMTLCNFVGIIATLFPWHHSSFVPMTGPETEGAEGISTKLSDMVTTGIGHPNGMAIAILFGITAIVLLVTPVKKQIPLALAIILTLLALPTVILSIVFFATVGPIAPANYQLADSGFSPAVWITFGCAVMTLLTGVVSIRHGIRNQMNEAKHRQRNSTHRKAEVAHTGELQGGPDWVTISQTDIDSGNLPNLCMICGEPSTECGNRTFHWQPKFFDELQKGQNPLSSLTKREFRLPCPTCKKHRHHWTRFIMVCSTGWIVPLVMGGCVAGLTELIGGGQSHKFTAILTPIFFFLPLGIWIATMIRMGMQQVRVVRIDPGEITLDRVSWKFAKKFRELTP